MGSVPIRKVELPVSSPHRVPSALRTRLMALPDFLPVTVAAYFGVLSVPLTLMIARGVTQYHRVVDPEFAEGLGIPLAMLWLILVSYLLGLGGHYVDAILNFSKAKKIREFSGSELNPRRAFRSLYRWMVCLMCGPAVPFAMAIHYWTYCGDPDVIDYLIIAELITASLIYGLVCRLVLSDSPKQRFARPRQVFDMIQRLGFRGIATCIGLTMMFMLLMPMAATALSRLSTSPVLSFLQLDAACFALLFSGAISLQLLGAWHHQTRKRATA